MYFFFFFFGREDVQEMEMIYLQFFLNIINTSTIKQANYYNLFLQLEY